MDRTPRDMKEWMTQQERNIRYLQRFRQTGTVVSITADALVAHSGAPTRAGVGRTTGWFFDAGVTESVSAAMSMPSSVPPQVSVLWFNPAVSTGDVRWSVEVVSLSAGGDVTSPGVVASVQAAAGPQNVLVETVVPVSITTGGLRSLVVSRVGGHVADTLPNDAVLVAVVLHPGTG